MLKFDLFYLLPPKVSGIVIGFPMTSSVSNLVMKELENEVIAGLDYVPYF